MKDHPILFNGEMDRAILDGRKTQTRRICTQPEVLNEANFGFPVGQYTKAVNAKGNLWAFQTDRWRPDKNSAYRQVTSKVFKCPYGVPVDLLWPREPFRINNWDSNLQRVIGTYTRDGRGFNCRLTDQERDKWLKWKKPYSGKSSLFMFKSLARLWLRVKSVRVEPVQEISEADAIAEGVKDVIRFGESGYEYYPSMGISKEAAHAHRCSTVCKTARRSFQSLWDSINAKPKPRYAKKEIIYYESYPWEAIRETRDHRGKPWHVYGNPHVFATEFERHDK